MNVGIRKASLADIDFIFDLTEVDSAAGHYVKYPSRPQALIAETLKLKSIIEQGVNLNPPLKSDAFIFEANNEVIGFAIILETPFQSSQDVGKPIIEVQMLSLHPDYRSKGYGSKCLDALIGMYPKKRMLMARCFPASMDMMNMLKRRGFHDAALLKGTHILLRGTHAEAKGFGMMIQKMHS